MQDKPKRPSAWQRGQKRVDAGLPRFTPAVIESRKAHQRQRAAARTAANVEFVTQLKLSLGCADCGYKEHAAALDFDHLPGADKKRQISRMVQASRNVLLREIAKCEVVCANCHRIRTWQRNQQASAA